MTIPSQPRRRSRLRRLAVPALIALAVVSLAAGTRLSVPTAAGQPGGATVSVMQTTLMEPNQRTAEVSTAELQKILADKSAYVFDARPPLEFAVSHIPGARNVAQKPGTPTSLYISDVAEIGRLVPGRDAALVLYCNGPVLRQEQAAR